MLIHCFYLDVLRRQTGNQKYPESTGGVYSYRLSLQVRALPAGRCDGSSEQSGVLKVFQVIEFPKHGS